MLNRGIHLAALIAMGVLAACGAAARSSTPTSTANAVPAAIVLRWPPNHATLHSADLPDFQFDAPGGPFVTRVTVKSPDLDFSLQIPDISAHTPTPMILADGLYTWQVEASRISGAGVSSEVWDFRIDSSCGCTDTPAP